MKRKIKIETTLNDPVSSETLRDSTPKLGLSWLDKTPPRFNFHKGLILALIISFLLSSQASTLVQAQEISGQPQSAGTESSPTPTPFPTNAPPVTLEEAIQQVPRGSENNREEDAIDLSVDTGINNSAELFTPPSVGKLLKKNFRANESIDVTVYNAKYIGFNVEIIDNKGDPVSIQIQENIIGTQKKFKIIPPSSIRPGKFTLKVTDSTGRSSFQDFTWGVLAINTNKSIYLSSEALAKEGLPKETARIAIGVLNEKGEMVCDANVVLQISDPNGNITQLSTENGGIIVNEECNLKDFTLKPDYETQYSIGSEIGKYEMILAAQTSNGIYSISDLFEVRKYVAFDVEREGPTRIYPPSDYTVKIKVKANEDFKGVITEVVPESFAILPTSSSSEFSVATSTERIVLGEEVLGASVDLVLPYEGNRPMASGFGEKSNDPLLQSKYEKYGVVGHDGVDFPMPIGAPVIVVDDGEVVRAKENSDYGTTVVVQHSWGKSYYGHLSEFKVKEGQIVSKGDVIALSGNTGLSTGPHLHLGIKPKDYDVENGYYGKVDPLSYLGLKEAKVLGATTVRDSKVKIISWEVDIKKGERLDLSYKFNAPDISPQFYTLGPIKFLENAEKIIFQEQRRWQIAVDAVPVFEAGEVTISDSLVWTSITLANSYTTAPVILATPVTNVNCGGTCTGNSAGQGGMYPIPIVRNVTTTSFDISMCVDGGATTCSTGMSAETFNWFAFDVDDAANYTWIEAGTTANVDVAGGNTAETFTTSFVAAPVVWTQAQTYSQGSNIGAHAWVNDTITTSGFTYIGCTHQGALDTCTGGTNETFGYVAIDVVNEAFGAGSNFQSGMADISNSDWAAATFSPTYTTPRVMVTQNDDDGGQDPEYAWAQSVTTSGMNFRYCEEDAGNVCNTHTSEKTYWFAIEEPVVGSATDQLHFRWRDDTTALNTTGGWLATEDNNTIGDITKNNTYRLRIESARTDGAESAAKTYELQWGEKTGATCGAISTWTGLANASDAFDMADSANISPDGESTTVGLLANTEGYTRVNGEGRDVADTTGAIGPLSASNYTELEYSFQATDNAVTGSNYCFRLYDTTAGGTLNSYSAYPEVTISSTNVSYNNTIMEWGTQAIVDDDAWITVNFSGNYVDPIFVCSSEYNANIGNESDGTADSVVCRVQNVGATSAQVRLQEPGTLVGAVGNLTAETIHWMVVEAGEYNNADIKMEAFKYTSTVTDGQTAGWTGQQQTLGQSYTSPVVLGQVMTTNDTAHSQFWAHNGSNGAPTTSLIYTGKHVSEDTTTTRSNETVGVIVIEQANNTVNSVVYETRLQTQTIDRIDDAPPSTYTFNTSFGTTPSVAIISLAGVSGTDGPYPSLYGTTILSTTTIDLVVMETEIVDTEQSGNTEFVPYIVFESAGTYAVTTNVALDQDTSRFYENTNAIQPSTALGNENTAITGVADSTVVRIRTALQVGDLLESSSLQFKLQYGQGATCSAIGSWTDVGGIGSGAIWRGYNNATPADGASVTASLLNATTNALESYEEVNNSVSNPAQISDGARGEWDWVVQNNGATANTDYCFRTVLSDASVIQYTNYPKLTTVGGPTNNQLMRHGKWFNSSGIEQPFTF